MHKKKNRMNFQEETKKTTNISSLLKLSTAERGCERTSGQTDTQSNYHVFSLCVIMAKCASKVLLNGITTAAKLTVM